jgi:signal transduction histidine kinase
MSAALGIPASAAGAPRLRLAAISAHPATRLGEFTFAGRMVPLAAFVAIAACICVAYGYDRSFGFVLGLLRLVLELCAAYLVAFALLAALNRAMGPNPPWPYVLIVAITGAALGGCVAAAIAFAPDWSTVWTTYPSTVLREWLLATTFSAFFIGLSLAAAAARQRERAESEARHRLAEDRLQLLAARIEPHFLMNTLANLRYLVRTDATTAHAMLDHLATFLQGALERSRDANSTLGHELEIVESYLAIMQMRLGEKLRFEITVPEALHDTPFPALLLQTLVENSITHGIGPADQPGLVWIRAREEYRHIVLGIGDNGVGFDGQGQPGQGVGLRNVRDRLEVFYRGRASFTIGSAAAGGTEALLVIPREQA